MRREQIRVFKDWLESHNWYFLLLVVAVVVVVIVLTVEAYRSEWAWTGLVGSKDYPDLKTKTAWDWMGLLIIPLVLVVGAYLFNRSERKSDREIAEQRRRLDQEIAEQRRRSDREIAEQRLRLDQEIAADRIQEDLLITYLDRMSELLTRGQLRDGLLGAEACHIARARTLTALRNLNPSRKSTIIQFLSDSSLTDGKILELSGASLDHTNLTTANLTEADLTGASLNGADLTRAYLTGADLTGASLNGAKLTGANLTEADLDGAYLTGANLNGADLTGADLTQANLTEADLTGACLSNANLVGAINVSNQQLAQAESLLGTTLPDGTKIETEEQEAAFKQQYGQGTE